MNNRKDQRNLDFFIIIEYISRKGEVNFKRIIIIVICIFILCSIMLFSVLNYDFDLSETVDINVLVIYVFQQKKDMVLLIGIQAKN